MLSMDISFKWRRNPGANIFLPYFNLYYRSCRLPTTIKTTIATKIENKCWNIQSRVCTKLTYLLKLPFTSISVRKQLEFINYIRLKFIYATCLYSRSPWAVCFLKGGGGVFMKNFQKSTFWLFLIEDKQTNKQTLTCIPRNHDCGRTLTTTAMEDH